MNIVVGFVLLIIAFSSLMYGHRLVPGGELPPSSPIEQIRDYKRFACSALSVSVAGVCLWSFGQRFGPEVGWPVFNHFASVFSVCVGILGFSVAIIFLIEIQRQQKKLLQQS